MRVPHIGASGAQLWRWFQYPKSDAEVELRLPTRTELSEIADAGGFRAELKRIAREFFRDFKNIEDANGVAVPNSLENRLLLLDDQDLGSWILKQLLAVKEWRDEGKDDGGSAS